MTELLISSADSFIKAKGNRNKKDKDGFASSVDAEKKKIAAAYLAAWKRSESLLKMSSILEQLDFIIDALAIGQSESKFERQCMSAALQQVTDEIDREMASEN